MARIQILELPTIYRENGYDETPFVLIVDQATEATAKALDVVGRSTAELVGARTVLVFEETVEIPANDVPVDPDGYPLKIRVEGDFEQFREQVQDEIRKASAQMRLGTR